MVCRRKTVNRIVLVVTNIIILTPIEKGSRFEAYRNLIGDEPNTPNSSEICTSEYCNFVAFWSQLYTLQDTLVFCSTTSAALRSNGEVVSEQQGAHCSTFSLSVSICDHLEASGPISMAVKGCWVVQLWLRHYFTFCCQVAHYMAFFICTIYHDCTHVRNR